MKDQVKISALGAVREDIAAWLDAFQVPNDLELQDALVNEEAKEFLAVFDKYPDPTVEGFEELLKEIADVVFTTTGYSILADRAGSDRKYSEETSKNLVMVMETFAFFTLVVKDDGVVDKAFIESVEAVVASNWTKLGPDGVPVRNEAGKVLKGPNYVPPNLRPIAEELFASF